MLNSIEKYDLFYQTPIKWRPQDSEGGEEKKWQRYILKRQSLMFRKVKGITLVKVRITVLVYFLYS